MSRKSLTILLAVAALVGLLAYGLLSKGGASLAVGEPAPDKSLPVLDGDVDRRLSLADFRGRWILVNFWASWCDPCRSEAPALQKIHEDRGGPRFTVLGINLDDSSDDAREFVSEYRLTYPQLRDGDGRERREAYGMTGFPETFLVDPRGRIALIRRGPVDREFLSREIEPLLDEAEGR